MPPTLLLPNVGHVQILFGEIEGALPTRLALCKEVLDIIDATLPPAPSRSGHKSAANGNGTAHKDAAGHHANGTHDEAAAKPAAEAMDQGADNDDQDNDEEEEEEENRRRDDLVHEALGGRGVEDDD